MDDLEAFLAIVEEGSQTAAARRLGRSPQSIYRSLAALEHSVGVELIRRTTRRSVATEAGLAFYRRVQPAVAAIAEARDEVADQSAEPQGLLRIGAPTMFATHFLVPAIVAFLGRFPKVKIELRASDQPADVIADGLDVAVRIRRLPDSSLRARRIGAIRTVVFGSPAYFARNGRPQRPEDLSRHHCVLSRGEGDAGESWPFCINGKSFSVPVSGNFKCSWIGTIRAAVCRGLGIGFGPYWLVRELVDRNELEIVLEAYECPPIPIQAVFPPSPMPPAKTRLFVDLLIEQMRGVQL